MTDRIKAMAELFVNAGKAHHQAFIETDGDDPDWPLWYANYMRESLSEKLGTELTISMLVYWLIKLDLDYRASGSEEPWPTWYSAVLIDHYS